MIRNFMSELKSRSSILYWFGWINLALFALAFVLLFLDTTMIMGINAWVKPMKFALSICIYAWTYGWLLHYSSNTTANKIIIAGLIISMTMEVSLIFMQAFRGTPSHFNVHTAFDGIVFGIMGLFIALNTIVNLFTVVIFFTKDISISGPALSAWRSGLILFFLGGISGGWMVAILSHTVGAPDGGPGLPFLNWSTVAGDIRAAHFVTMHALQAIPLVTYGLTQTIGDKSGRWVALFTVGYATVAIYLHYLAWSGLPVIGKF